MGSTFGFASQAGAVVEVFTPTGTISAATVQNAIAEAALEALQKSGDTATGTITTSGVVFGNQLTAAEAINLTVGTSTGTQIGTGATQKLGLYGVTPVVQATRANQLVDSSGGTGNSNTVAVITGAVDPTAALLSATQNAVATIVARVNALETRVHNIGISA